jgi:hypothetical protein
MITKPEDLLNKYVLRSDKEVFEKYMDFCELHGIPWESGREPREQQGGIKVLWDGCLTFSDYEYEGRKGLSKITMEDFTVNKKTKTEYIKTDKEIWDLRGEFESGLVYWGCHDNVGIIKVDKHTQLRTLLDNDLYIKTEIEIPWHERLDDFSYPLTMFHINTGFGGVWSKEELKELGQYLSKYRPATKAEIQTLLDNAPE